MAHEIKVDDIAPRQQYLASAGQTVFDIPWKFFENADLKVYLTPVGQEPDDPTDILAEITDYTVIGAGTNTGPRTITLVTPATENDTITIQGDVPIERLTDFNDGDFKADTVNDELDTIFQIMLQLEEYVQNRMLLYKQTVNLGNTDLSMPAPEPLKGIRWNEAGDALENVLLTVAESTIVGVDPSTTINAGEGLAGGGNLTQNRTLRMAIEDLLAKLSPDPAADYVVVHSAADGGHKKVLLANLPAVTQSIFANDPTGTPSLSNEHFPVETSIVRTFRNTNIETVGPTGSGKDNIWPALDLVPAGADWIAVRVRNEGKDFGVPGAEGYQHVFACEDGINPPHLYEVVGGTIYDIGFNNDGTRAYFYSLVTGLDKFLQLDLAIPYVIGSWTSVTDYFSKLTGSIYSFHLKPDGTKLYALSQNETVHQYSLSTPWDLNTLTDDAVSFDVSPQTGASLNAWHLRLSSDGTKMYVLDNSTNIFQYTLSTAWALGTASYASLTYNLNSGVAGTHRCFDFNDDESVLYSGTWGARVYQFSLSTPGNISTASYTGKFANTNQYESAISGMYVSPGVNQLYFGGSAADSVWNWPVLTPGDINTARPMFGELGIISGISDASNNVRSENSAIAIIPVTARAFQAWWTSDFIEQNIALTLVGYGYNGEIYGASTGTDQFAPYAQAIPDLTVRIASGQVYDGATYITKAIQVTPEFTVPTTDPRIDRIVLDNDTGVISVVAGTEAATPSAPEIPENSSPLASILLTVGMTEIGNSNITDERVAPFTSPPPPPAGADGALLGVANWFDTDELPTSATMSDVAEGVVNGRPGMVMVGTRVGGTATLYYSYNGNQWFQVAGLKDVNLFDVVYDTTLGLWVAVGASDGVDTYILSSSNGLTWTERASPVNLPLFGLTSHNGTFVAVGAPTGTEGLILSSTDGITWTQRTSDTSSVQLNGVAVNDSGLFVAVGEMNFSFTYPEITSSPDGITWTNRGDVAINDDEALENITFGGGFFVAVGDNGYMAKSDNGINWTKVFDAGVLTVQNFQDIAYGDGVFVAVGGDLNNSYIATSSDTITWKQRFGTKTDKTIYGIEYSANFERFIACGQGSLPGYALKSLSNPAS